MDYFEVLCALKRYRVLSSMEKECSVIAYLMELSSYCGCYNSCFLSLNSIANAGNFNYLIWTVNRDVIKRSKEIGRVEYLDDVDESLYVEYEHSIPYRILSIKESSIPSWFSREYQNSLGIVYKKAEKKREFSTGDKELDNILKYMSSSEK